MCFSSLVSLVLLVCHPRLVTLIHPYEIELPGLVLGIMYRRQCLQLGVQAAFDFKFCVCGAPRRPQSMYVCIYVWRIPQYALLSCFFFSFRRMYSVRSTVWYLPLVLLLCQVSHFIQKKPCPLAQNPRFGARLQYTTHPFWLAQHTVCTFNISILTRGTLFIHTVHTYHT